MVRLLALLIAAGIVNAQPARAQQYPDRPIKIIVPLLAGSASDNAVRIVGAKLTQRLGQQIIVENRVGGSTIIGTEAVARAAPDGYTIGLANTSTHATASALANKLPFDPVKDFAPIGMIGNSPFMLVASAKLPVANMQRADRARKEQARRPDLCVGRRRDHCASRRRAVQEDGGRPDPSRTLSRNVAVGD